MGKKGEKQKIKQKRLNGRMDVSLKAKQLNENDYSVISWFVRDYDKLEKGVLYSQMYRKDNLQFVLKLIRKEEKLYVALRIGYKKAHVKCLLDNGIPPLTRAVDTTEVSEGLYVAEFPNDLVFDLRGFLSKVGVLRISFSYFNHFKSCRWNDRFPYLPIFHTDALCADLRLFYTSSKDKTDFKIFVAGNASLLAHKCVLYARSRFFKEYFQKTRDVDSFSMVDVELGIMYEVLIYMYSGELSDMDVESMLRIYEMACLLRIPSLKDRCFSYFKERDLLTNLKDKTLFEYQIDGA